MSIIFDALKRADAQRQKGQVPTLAATQIASQARSRLRLWALASLFVVLGISAWWFRGSSTKDSDAIAVNAVVKPENSAADGAGELTTGQSLPQADLSLRAAPAEVSAAVIATNLSAPDASDLGTNSAARLSLPSLDTPLTGAAQFDRKAAPIVVAAPPVAPPVKVAAKPVVTPEPVNSKPAEALVAASPVPAAPALAPPVLTPEPAASSALELPSIFELDYQVRHDLPKMAISMYVYNAQQQFRFVIIAGKRYAEGEQIESKVSITKIRADGIECEFQGTKFFYPRQSL